MIYRVGDTDLIKALLITKTKGHMIVGLPKEVLVNHNCGVAIENPFNNSDSIFFLSSFDENRKVYVFKE